jgi:hypothetical protein
VGDLSRIALPILQFGKWSLLRLFCAWVVLAAAVFSGGQALLLAAHTPLEWLIECILPDFIVHIVAASPNSEGDIRVLLHAIKAVPITATYNITPWVDIQLDIYSGHELSPSVLLLGILSAWPIREARSRWKLLLAGLVSSAAILAYTIPVHITGLLEIRLQLVAGQYREPRAEPWYLHQMLILESGGLWLIPILVAMALLLRYSDVKAVAA